MQTAQNQVLDLVLPTDNDAFFRRRPAFYQSVDRDYNGAKSAPGKAANTALSVIRKARRRRRLYPFHEGIDIRSVHRDANGEPLDEVRAIADGEVVHVNLVPGYSNYGKYVVIEHGWNGSNYYSLVRPSQLGRGATR
jgi:murein DD-endopeptidase MepM/ murein hydrolase activator NlpD